MMNTPRISDAQWTVTSDDIRAARLARGLTQYQAALAIGSTAPTWSLWESKSKGVTPSPVYRAKLVELFGAKALGLDLDDGGPAR